MRISTVNNSAVLNNENVASTTNNSTLKATAASSQPTTLQVTNQSIASPNRSFLQARQSFDSLQIRAALDAKLANSQPLKLTPASIMRLINVNQRDSSGRTPLMEAAVQADIGKMRALIAAGADVNAADQFGQTPLFFALYGKFQPQPEAVRILIAAGANVNAHDIGGRTPLIRAINSVDLMHQLIAAGANLNAQTTEGITALISCAYNGQLESAKLLIHAGANLNIRNKQGKTALTIAEETGHYQIAALLRAAGAHK